MAELVPVSSKPTWSLREDGLYEVQTPYYKAVIAPFLDAACTDGQSLLQFTEIGSAYTVLTRPQMIAYVDAVGNLDSICALPPVPAEVKGAVVEYHIPESVELERPDVRVRYTAGPNKVKLEILLDKPFRAPDPALDQATTILSVSGPVTVGEGLTIGTKTGGTGDLATPADLYIRDAQGNTVVTLDRIKATDHVGWAGAGEFRIIQDVDGTPRLHQGMPVSWLSEAEYPVTIDPTLVVSSATLPGGGHRLAVLSDGTRYSVQYASGNKIYVSKDGGQTWTAVAGTPGGGALDEVDLWRGPNDEIFYTYGGVSGTALTIQRWVPSADRLSLSGVGVAAVTVAAASGTIEYRRPRLMGTGTAGSPLTVWCVRNRYSSSDGSQNLHATPVTVAVDGTMTAGSLVSLSTGTDTVYHSLCQTADGSIYVGWLRQGSTAWGSRLVDGTGPTQSVTISSSTAVSSGAHGLSAPYWQVGTQIVGQTAVVYSFPANTFGSSSPERVACVGLPNLGAVAVIALRGSAVSDPNYPGCWTVNVSTGTASDRGAVETTVAGNGAHHTINASVTNGQIPFLFSAASAIYSDTALINQAPYAASVTLGSSSFDASTGTSITIGHSDPDGGNMTAYALKRIWGTTTEYWRASDNSWQTVETWNTSSGTSATIAAASNASKWTNGRAYQMSAATKDDGGLTGPYTPTPTIANTGATPTATITSPASSVSSGSVTVTWTSDSPQGHYQVRLLDSAGTTELATSGKVASQSARAYAVPVTLSNATTYKAEVTIWDQTGAAGIASTPAVQSFTTSFTPPLTVAAPTVTADSAKAALLLSWLAQRNQSATFSRTSTAIDPLTGASVAAGAPRYGTYSGRTSVLIEGAATNLLSANQSSVETDTVGFNINSGATISRDTTKAWVGSASLKVVTPGAVATEGAHAFLNISTHGTYNGQLRINGASGTVDVWLRAVYSDSSSSTDVKTAVTLDGTWKLVTTAAVTTDTAKTLTQLQLFFRTNTTQAITYNVDGLMIQSGSFATSWTPGGTPRTAETLTLSSSGLSPTQGTISVWFYLPQLPPASSRAVLVSDWHGASTGTTTSIDWHVDAFGRLVFHASPSGGGAESLVCQSAAGTVVAGAWTLATLAWNNGAVTITKNTTSVATGNLPAASTSLYPLSQTLTVGSFDFPWNTYSHHLNGYLSEVRLSTVARSVSDAAAYYTAGTATWDQYTLALPKWASSLQSGNQSDTYGGTSAIERSTNGTNWTRLTTVEDAAIGTGLNSWSDYSIAAGVSYQYRIVPIGTNGTETAGSASSATSCSWNDWVFRPVDGSSLVTFSAGPARAPWRQNQEINVPETQSEYRREYVGSYKARTVDLSAVFGLPTETAFTVREYLRTLVLDRAEGWLKSPSGDVLRGKLRDLSGETRLPTKWEDLRVGFVEMREVS